jgi:uncharacterized membrane protein YbhN (UPF0104 family)
VFTDRSIPPALLPLDHTHTASRGRRGTRSSPRHERSWLPLALVGGGSLVVARMLTQIGVGAVLAAVTKAGPQIALVLAAPFVGQVLHGLGWRTLLPSAARPDLARSYRVFVAAQAGNELGASVLGEPLKVLALPKEHEASAVAAVLLDNATCLVALFAFFTTTGVVTWPAGVWAPRAARLFALVATVMLVLLPILWSSRNGVRALWEIQARHPMVARVRAGWHACRAVVTERPKAIAAAFLFHFAGKLWIVVEFSLVLRALGCGSLHSSAALGFASATAAMVGAPVPGQVGVVEAAVVFAATACGIPPATALAVVVVRRVRGSLWTIIGLFLLPRTRKSS